MKDVLQKHHHGSHVEQHLRGIRPMAARWKESVAMRDGDLEMDGPQKFWIDHIQAPEYITERRRLTL